MSGAFPAGARSAAGRKDHTAPGPRRMARVQRAVELGPCAVRTPHCLGRGLQAGEWASGRAESRRHCSRPRWSLMLGFPTRSPVWWQGPGAASPELGSRAGVPARPRLPPWMGGGVVALPPSRAPGRRLSHQLRARCVTDISNSQHCWACFACFSFPFLSFFLLFSFHSFCIYLLSFYFP